MLRAEGCSVRTVQRIPSVHRDTIMRLLVTAGERCESLPAPLIERSRLRTRSAADQVAMSG